MVSNYTGNPPQVPPQSSSGTAYDLQVPGRGTARAGKQPRPSKREVFTWLEQRRSILAQMQRRMMVADDWIHADEEPSPVIQYINEGFKDDWNYDIFPYAWTVLNRGLNQIQTAEVPEVTYELPAKAKKAHKGWDDDEKAVQAWAQGLIYKLVTQSTENPFNDLLQQQLGLGLGSLHYPLDYDAIGTPPDHGKGSPEEIAAWDDYDRQRADAIPWRVSSLHPTWLFFDVAHDPPIDYIIERPISLLDAERLFPDMRFDPADAPAPDGLSTIYYREYHSAEWYGCWVGELPVTDGDDADEDGISSNACNHTWIAMAWSGFGKKDMRAAWHRRGIGLVQRGISTFKAQTRDDNILALIKSIMIPKYIGQGIDKENVEQEVADFDPTSPATGVLTQGTTLRPVEVPTIPPALIEDARQHSARTEMLFGPGILSGKDAGAGEPASKWAARTEAARGPYRAPKKNAEQAAATMLADMLYDVAHDPALTEGVAVAYEQGGKAGSGVKTGVYAELKPAQIHPGGKFTFDFSPMSRDERQARTEDTEARQKAGWISVETAMKDGGEVEDTETEMAEILADHIMASPEFIGAQAQLAMSAIQAAIQQQNPQTSPVGVPAPIPGQPVLSPGGMGGAGAGVPPPPGGLPGIPGGGGGPPAPPPPPGLPGIPVPAQPVGAPGGFTPPMQRPMNGVA